MGWGWGAGTRLGLEETKAAQIAGPTNFSLQHRTTTAPTVSVGQGEGGDRRWQGTWGEDRVKAGEDNALQVGHGEFGVFSRWCGQESRLVSNPSSSIS